MQSHIEIAGPVQPEQSLVGLCGSRESGIAFPEFRVARRRRRRRAPGPLELYRGEIAERRMATAPVVKALQEFEDLALRLLAALERGALQQFAFDCGEQALGHGVIETAA